MECLSIIKEHIGINILFAELYNLSLVGKNWSKSVIIGNL